jgi:energy-coupling factor transport system substrate-specific component
VTDSQMYSHGRRFGKRLIKSKGIILAALLLILVYFSSATGVNYLFLSTIIVVVSVFKLYLEFEQKNVSAENMVLCAVMASIAAVARVPFTSIPSVQPTSFVIIMTALVFGPDIGFVVGSTSAFVSNLFIGQGPWTPWQMFGWGLMGYTAGKFLRQKTFNKTSTIIFGLIWGFLFGWIMNLWFFLGYIRPINIKTFIAACIASFYFDLAHALSNGFFIGIFGNRWFNILQRLKIKYM